MMRKSPPAALDPLTVDIVRGRISRDGAHLGVTNQQLAIVIALALHREGLTLERLADLVYAAGAPASPTAAVKVHVYRLRRRVCANLVVTHGCLYFIGSDVKLVQPDDSLAVPSPDALRRRTVSELTTLARYAASLRAEPPIGFGLEYLDWYTTRLTSYCRAGRDLAIALAREFLQRGRYPEALDIANRLTREDRCDEEAGEIAIRAHLSQGKRGAAIRAYSFLRDALEGELGLAPSNGLLRLLYD